MQYSGLNQPDEVDEIDEIGDARWNQADEMKQKDEMKEWGLQMKAPRWKARASPQFLPVNDYMSA